ncbi:MAG: hypothetical protein ACE5GX_07665 [Thermoanaerobaculia bacterium]
MALIACGVATADGASGVMAGVTASCDDPVKGRNFNDDFLELDLLLPDGFDEQNFFCTLGVKNSDSSESNNGQKGVKVRFTGQVVNDAGNTVGILNNSGKTKKNGYYQAFFFLPSNAAGVNVNANVAGAKRLNQAYFACGASGVPPCQPDNTTLCLRDNRFKVEVDWESPSLGSGEGMVLSSSNVQGGFYFINPNNQDLLVQLLNACSNNDHFWVFTSATTSVEYDMTVTDTVTGSSRVYSNELGQPAQAITDTSAFATCP